ncbi:hypothetical protein AVEN_49345-1 [Araneus ventricosus]|uniref:Uncharacterized protein n=1 Tax=Araneus ventricosus TaxID=182803 RepID=A0A4Y2LRK2_ARAVE|nr:hypothetical protein AVEN_49345-1 [Araneus ventricosus]
MERCTVPVMMLIDTSADESAPETTLAEPLKRLRPERRLRMYTDTEDDTPPAKSFSKRRKARSASASGGNSTGSRRKKRRKRTASLELQKSSRKTVILILRSPENRNYLLQNVSFLSSLLIPT